MHLLGRSIRIEVNPGTPQARTVLDIPVWDFDDQGARPIDPVQLEPVRHGHRSPAGTCSGCATGSRRSRASPDRYVVWGEGTTDEMCLGILHRHHAVTAVGGAAVPSRSMDSASSTERKAARTGHP